MFDLITNALFRLKDATDRLLFFCHDSVSSKKRYWANTNKKTIITEANVQIIFLIILNMHCSSRGATQAMLAVIWSLELSNHTVLF